MTKTIKRWFTARFISRWVVLATLDEEITSIRAEVSQAPMLNLSASAYVDYINSREYALARLVSLRKWFEKVEK